MMGFWLGHGRVAPWIRQWGEGEVCWIGSGGLTWIDLIGFIPASLVLDQGDRFPIIWRIIVDLLIDCSAAIRR